MGLPAGQLVDLVLRRVRDPWGIATSRAFVRELMGHAQWMVNLASPSVLREAVMPTYAGMVIYDFPTLGLVTRAGDPIDPTDILRVDCIRVEGDRDLVMVDWNAYAMVDRDWIKRTGTPEWWSRMGRNLVVISPSRDLDDTAKLVYVARTATFGSDDTLSEIRDDRLPAMLGLTEALILLHRRLYPAALSAMQTVDTILARLPSASDTGVADFVPLGGSTGMP